MPHINPSAKHYFLDIEFRPQKTEPLGVSLRAQPRAETREPVALVEQDTGQTRHLLQHVKRLFQHPHV